MAFLTPPALSKRFVAIGEQKARLPGMRMFLLGVLAGAYIGFGAHLATVVGTGECAYIGLKKLLVGGVFSLGLILVVIAGAELFTGNALMVVSAFERRITWRALMRNWLIVYLGNLVGSILLAFIIARSSGLLAGPVGATAIGIAYHKVADVPIGSLGHNYAYFFRAIGCNWLVCLAVMLAVAAEDIGGKILGIFFPIMGFVAMGFEHCVANMYFIPAGIFALHFERAELQSGLSPIEVSQLTWGHMWTGNLISVSLGNIVGGAVFTGLLYWLVYVRKQRDNATDE